MKKFSVTIAFILEVSISGLLKIISIILMGSLLLMSAGCKKEGSLEKAGKKIDKAIKETGDRIEQVSDDMQKALENAEETKERKE